MSQDFPRINGREYSFAQVRIRVLGKDYYGVQSINYKVTKTKGLVRGNTQELIGKTRGNREYTCDMEMLRREFEQLKTDILAIKGPDAGFGDVDFDIEVMYREAKMPVIIDEISGSNIDEVDLSNAQGTDPSTVSLTLSPFRITLNRAEI